MKEVSFGLSVDSIEKAITQIKEFQNDLRLKNQAFIEALLQEGIETAKHAVSGTEYGTYITFSKKINPNKSGVIGLMIGTNTGIIQSEWLQADGTTKVADVSPLLMMEFGSGRYAQNPKAVPGVGRGTFPGQTHADQAGWWYATGTPENKVWHYSSGVVPEQPMFKAILSMQQTVKTIAQRIYQ